MTKRRESCGVLGELVKRIAARDEQSLRSLYDATITCVYGIAWQVLRERAAAEVYRREASELIEI